jgi:cytochrome-b5 reductase
MHSLKEGDSVNVKGPFAKLDYQANKYKKIGMVAGGTGIAPMIQVGFHHWAEQGTMRRDACMMMMV